MFRSFAATFRPREGINDDAISSYLKWFEDKKVFACLEKEGHERHIHFQIWFDEPKRRVDVDKQIKRIAKRHTEWDDATAKHAVMTRIAYNDWYLSYLSENELKPEDPNIIYNNVPASTIEYYPSEEEDELMKARIAASDSFYHELKEKWDVYSSEKDISNPTLRHIAEYLHYRQHIIKDMRVTRDKKNAQALVHTLHMYITGDFQIDWWIAQTKQDKIADNIIQSVQQLIPDLT